MTDIDEIAKRRGFFWPSSAIYGGLSGLYDYGHLGTLVKRKWENLWRKFFLGLDHNYYEIEACNIMPRDVFRGSGHLESFVDPIVKCNKCDNTERADQILEENLKENFEGMEPRKLDTIINKHNITCQKCGGKFKEAEILSLMFQLNLRKKEAQELYLRPETAQGPYLNFNREFETLRKKLPLGLGVIGKAYRDEISPRNTLIRMREFTQAELQIFFDPDNIDNASQFANIRNYELVIFDNGERKEISSKKLSKRLPKFYIYHLAKIQQFYLELLNIPKKRFRFRKLSEEEKAFYNKYHFDIELKMDNLKAFKEVGGLHYRTDHDLKGHEKTSGKNLHVNVNGKKILPHVLEISMGVDRNIYALLDIFHKEKKRTLLQLPRLVAPYDTGVFPLVAKDELPEKAKEIKTLLEDQFNIFYDQSGSIGRRYRRIDEIGVPAGITIDYQTLKDDTVTIRDRDSMKQIRVPIKKLPKKLLSFIHGKDLEDLE